MTTFKTSDTPLAAWLIISGIKLQTVNSSINPNEFVFIDADRESLNDLIFQWDGGNAVGNCNSFYKTYRSLVHKIKAR
jgi:hypothetical protein